MSMAYDPSSRSISKVIYYVANNNAASNYQWFIPTVKEGDEPDAGTNAQRLAQCEIMVGSSLGEAVEV